MTSVNGFGDEHIAMLLDLAFRRLREELGGSLGAAHPRLRSSHLRLLSLIPDDGARITDLAGRAAMTKQALGQLVDHLQTHGYVESVPNPADRRVRIVRRTATGDAANLQSLGAIARLEEDWRAELGDRRYVTMRNALRDVGAKAANAQTTV